MSDASQPCQLPIAAASLMDQLEQLLDRYSAPSELLYDLSLIAYGKQSHVEENWQDSSLGKAWQTVGSKFAMMAVQMSKVRNPYEG